MMFIPKTPTDWIIFRCLFTKLVNDLEALETPQWAADEILKHEICTNRVIDPNCGTGVLADAARRNNYHVIANDICNWGYPHQDFDLDFLSDEAVHHMGKLVKGATVIMNPPFKLTIPFFNRAKALGARKIILFQNHTFYTSIGRKDFWDGNEPTRIYICAERATTWRFDIPDAKRKGTTTKTFAFFVWDGFANNVAPTNHRLYKPQEKGVKS